MTARARRDSAFTVLLNFSLFIGILHGSPQDQAPPDSVRAPQRVISFEHINQALVLKCQAGLLVVKPYADNIVHITYFPRPEKQPMPLWGFNSIIPDLKYRVDSTGDALRLATSQMTVSVGRRNAQLTFLDQKQRVLVATRQYYLQDTQVSGEPTYKIHAEFEAPDTEAYYGLGQHQNGWMDLRGKTVPLWHDAHAKEGEVTAIPFLVTNSRYGIVFDNPSRSTVVPGKDGLTTWDAEAGDMLSYFVIYGNATDDLYRGYRLLTGTTPLPPKYGLGYIQGRRSYKSRDDLLQVARNYREKDYPADVLVADMGEQGVDDKAWPDLQSMNVELDKMGFKVMVSCRSRFKKESARFSALDSMGCLMKDKDGKAVLGLGDDNRGGLIDLTKSQCAAWFWNSMQETYAAKGFTSWWLDESEPGLSPQTFFLNAGPGAKVLNVYPLLLAKAIFEGQRQDLKARSLILSRSAYLGSQQYSAALSSGEVAPQWDALGRQIAAGLGVTASGLPYWSSEIGGTGVARDQEGYPELYVRWFEYGAFCPLFTAGGSRPENEVWAYGEATDRIAASYLRLRYRLMPYLYSLAHSVTETGAPFMRALFMDFPTDPEVRDLKDEYMFGPAFLVAPVVEKGKTSREVYLPKGTTWYDYWTGKKYEGGERILADAPLEILPLFVRAGSIIPHGNDISSTRVDQKEIELRVYAGADGRFDLYQDDGLTYEYEKGKFSLAQIRWSDSTQKIAITGDDRGLFSRPQDKWLKVIK